MTAETPVLAHLAAVEMHVRIARGVWDPSNLSACAECSEQLQRAIDEMTAASQAAPAEPAPREAKARLEQVRADVEGLQRLVDAAIAFGRGLALRTASPELADSQAEGYIHG